MEPTGTLAEETVSGSASPSPKFQLVEAIVEGGRVVVAIVEVLFKSTKRPVQATPEVKLGLMLGKIVTVCESELAQPTPTAVYVRV